MARDDGSTDGTREILAHYSAAHPPGRMVIVAQDARRLGASGSFAALLGLSEAPYVMFCDQDDVWLPDKVTLDRQAAAFAARYDERVAPAERAMLRAFCTLHAKGFFGRQRLMLKYNFLLSDWWQNFMMLLR